MNTPDLYDFWNVCLEGGVFVENFSSRISQLQKPINLLFVLYLSDNCQQNSGFWTKNIQLQGWNRSIEPKIHNYQVGNKKNQRIECQSYTTFKNILSGLWIQKIILRILKKLVGLEGGGICRKISIDHRLEGGYSQRGGIHSEYPWSHGRNDRMW